MFFIVSKILGPLSAPVNVLLLCGLLGLALQARGRWRPLGRGLCAGALVLLAVACFSPLANVLMRPLEDRFPKPARDAPAPDGIIVLGGAMNEDLTAARGATSLTDAAERLTHGVVLARRYPGALLVFTGGSARLAGRGLDEARGVRQLWLDLGVPPERMVFEDKSRNTFENATMTRALVRPQPGQRWLLVTSAAHMPRSVGIFRKAGWPVIADPVDYRTYGNAHDLRPSLDALDNLTKLDVAAHEWSGLVAYWLTGKTSALFPAP